MKEAIDFLLKMEETDRDFWWGRGSGNDMWTSYNGYNHMNLIRIDEVLRKKFKVQYDFEKGITKFDRVCGKTFYYYKDFYKEES